MNSVNIIISHTLLSEGVIEFFVKISQFTPPSTKVNIGYNHAMIK